MTSISNKVAICKIAKKLIIILTPGQNEMIRIGSDAKWNDSNGFWRKMKWFELVLTQNEMIRMGSDAKWNDSNWFWLKMKWFEWALTQNEMIRMGSDAKWNDSNGLWRKIGRRRLTRTFRTVRQGTFLAVRPKSGEFSNIGRIFEHRANFRTSGEFSNIGRIFEHRALVFFRQFFEN
jgi:hypothetical protein